MQPISEQEQIRGGRAKFLSMAATYFLGVFNDNFFKQAAMLIAVSAGLSSLQGTATVLFSLPFILFSVYGGWLADRYPKRNVVIGAKFLELLAMLIGGIGIVTGNWPCIMSMVFLMATQSALFGPSLNGSIPELYPESYVTKANAILKLVTTLAVLIGVAAAGVVLDLKGPDFGQVAFGKILTGFVVILIAGIGIATGFGVCRRPAAAPQNKFPWAGPFQSLRDFIQLRQDKKLLLAILADAFFYFVASLTILVLNTLGLLQLQLSQTTTSLLPVSLMIGVCAGSFLAAKYTSARRWTRVIIPAAAGMGLGLVSISTVSHTLTTYQGIALFLSLIFAGCAGGLFLIPVTSFIQIKPASHEKGKVIAVAGFASFCAILLSGQMFSILDAYFAPNQIIGILGAFCLMTSAGIAILNKRRFDMLTAFLNLLIRVALRLRYRIKVSGLQDIDIATDNKSILFLANHPAVIDPIILVSELYNKFRPRPLADQDQINRPIVRTLTGMVNTITIPDLRKNGNRNSSGVQDALNKVIHSLKSGDNVLLYPAGRLMRSAEEQLGATSAVEQILREIPDQRIILVRVAGLWGSSFSWHDGPPPSPFKHLRKYISFLAVNGLFFGPRRKVEIELTNANDFPVANDRMVINRYLENFFNSQEKLQTYVPYSWFAAKDEARKEAKKQTVISRDLSLVPESIKKIVINKIQTSTGADNIKPADNLAGDLAMDSLTLMDLMVWLENEFGFPQEDMASLHTVGDFLLAATGRSFERKKVDLKAVKSGWYTSASNNRLSLTEKDSLNLAEVFLKTAGKRANECIIADQPTGVKTYRDIITAIYILKPHLESIPGNRLGIMMPASVGGTILYLAALFAGKTPVMMNWTIGRGQMEHCCSDADVSHILTSKALMEKLDSQGLQLTEIQIHWMFLEELIQKTTLLQKTKALMKSYLSWSDLKKAHISETAVILFTSGSESKPKSVPLTHANILANMKDFADVVQLYNNDRLLGMLPPFHSLGLVGTMLMPLCLGLKTVYHANPTESLSLARIIEHYRVTTLISTPTFLSGIIQSGTKEQLFPLRLAFTGAEKCADHIYRYFETICPHATLCEGYGITECSPVVSLNYSNPSPGSIGRILPSMEYVITYPDTNKKVLRGEQGLLLVRGPNVFKGYLNGAGKNPFKTFAGRQWYNTGDLVKENSVGELIFCGRLKRFIKLGGEMISLPAIENALSQNLDINNQEGPALAIEATPVEENPEVVLFTTTDIDREEANKKIRQAGLSALHNIRRLIRVDEIPVLGTGKTNYRELKERLAA